MPHRRCLQRRAGRDAGGPTDGWLDYGRDEQGRLISVTEVYDDQDSAPIPRLRVEYRQDGSVIEEHVVDGDIGDGYHRTEWSRGCSELLPLMSDEPRVACEPVPDRPGDTWIR